MRPQVYSLHHVLKGLRTLSREAYTPPPPTEAVLVDTADSATFDRGAGYYHPAMKTRDKQIFPESEQLLDQFLAQARWRSLSRNEVTLLLREEHPAEPKPIKGDGRPLDKHHRLVGVQVAPPPAGDTALILFTYELEAGRQIAPWVRLYLQGEGDRQYAITKGPILLGKPPGVVTESWAIRPPAAIPPGTYQGILYFFDNHESLYPEEARLQRRTFTLGELKILGN
jgi:hypothetical protein